jgi:hypothetical protein
MPANPPVQVPPQTGPQNFPRPNMPMPGQAGVPPLPADVSRATLGGIARTNAMPGSLGGTAMPAGASPGVRLLDAAPPPQSTSQGGPVPPPTPSQTLSPAQILADQAHNSPATGMAPTSSGDAGAHAVTGSQFMTPAAAARQQWLQDRARALLGPNAPLTNQALPIEQGGRGMGLGSPAGGSYGTDWIPQDLLRSGAGFNPAMPRPIAPAGPPMGGLAWGAPPPPPAAGGNADAMNAAMLEYLRQQAQMSQG